VISPGVAASIEIDGLLFSYLPSRAIQLDKSDGQGLAGFKDYTRKGKQQKEAVNGVIGLDGNVLIVDEDGTFQGRLVDGTENRTRRRVRSPRLQISQLLPTTISYTRK